MDSRAHPAPSVYRTATPVPSIQHTPIVYAQFSTAETCSRTQGSPSVFSGRAGLVRPSTMLAATVQASAEGQDRKDENALPESEEPLLEGRLEPILGTVKQTGRSLHKLP